MIKVLNNLEDNRSVYGRSEYIHRNSAERITDNPYIGRTNRERRDNVLF